jgi:hypothetical protein
MASSISINIFIGETMFTVIDYLREDVGSSTLNNPTEVL